MSTVSLQRMYSNCVVVFLVHLGRPAEPPGVVRVVPARLGGILQRHGATPRPGAAVLPQLGDGPRSRRGSKSTRLVAIAVLCRFVCLERDGPGSDRFHWPSICQGHLFFQRSPMLVCSCLSRFIVYSCKVFAINGSSLRRH